MRKWWILSGLFVGLSGCGMFGDEDEGSSDGSDGSLFVNALLRFPFALPLCKKV